MNIRNTAFKRDHHNCKPSVPHSWEAQISTEGQQRGVCVCVLSRSVVSDSCDPIDCSLVVSSVRRILQERILEWVAISSSRGSSST